MQPNRRRDGVARGGGVAVGGSGVDVGQRGAQRRVRRRSSDTLLTRSLRTSQEHHWILTKYRRPDGAQYRNSLHEPIA